MINQLIKQKLLLLTHHLGLKQRLPLVKGEKKRTSTGNVNTCSSLNAMEHQLPHLCGTGCAHATSLLSDSKQYKSGRVVMKLSEETLWAKVSETLTSNRKLV